MSDTALMAKLPAILAAHAAWRRGDDGGSRADLSGAYLSRADLSGAYLSGADLRGADLSRAYLSGAYLRGADLSGADLSGADLRGADLSRADLSGADLRGANLSGAYLSGAYLSDVNGLDPLPFGPVTLPDGPFRAYKLARGTGGARVIVTLEIPEDAQRVAPLVERKCRASAARVLALSDGSEAQSWHTDADRAPIMYRAGEMVTPDKYDPSPFVECSHGIHFYISRREAEEHS
jgi:hypothetical protein